MVFQNLLADRYKTVIFGAVGDDEEGIFLEKYTNNAFVETRYVLPLEFCLKDS